MTTKEMQIAMLTVAKEMTVDPHHRLYSWDHSNTTWRTLLANPAPSAAELDNATLHLAFYLASWGMYRGSSRMLQRDYKVLLRASRWLHGTFWNWKSEGIELQDLLTTECPASESADLLLNLAEDLRRILVLAQSDPVNPAHAYEASETLITKILLNVFACIPAFDTEVKKALPTLIPRFNTGPCLNQVKLVALREYMHSNLHILKAGQTTLLHNLGIMYPLTKIFDLYLWKLGPTL